MLAPLPTIVCTLILAVVGALTGAFINRSIYAWPYFLKRPIGPWLRPDSKTPARKWPDYIPIVGWFGLRREHKIHGAGFWMRPLLIEIVWTIGLPWFYYWQLGGGLTGGPIVPLPPSWNLIVETWFIGHSILIALMFIATFIDFDERTIPDSITIPGTLIALVIAAACPWFRLPQVIPNLGGKLVEPIHFASTRPLPDWHATHWGVVAAVAVFTIWILALLPKVCTLRYGVFRGLKFMLASCLRPRRKKDCELRTIQRRPATMTIMLGVLWLLGVSVIVLAKQLLPPANWDSLFGSFFGLAFGGGMVWSIRIVARHAMQKEAMGFGDVTLMAMIGAFLGWQSALLTFAIAPFAALLIVFVCFLITKDNELAFGPYLCFGCMMLLFFWSNLWPAMAQQFFFLGPWLFVFLLVALVLMPVLLVLLQWVKGFFQQELQP